MNKDLLSVEGKQEFMGVEVTEITGGFGQGKKAVLAKDIAEIHGVELRMINQNINRNRKRFKDNVDIIDLKNSVTQSDSLLSLLFSKQQIANAKNIYLLSERGYAKLIKIMDDDKSWEVHDQLVDDYFQLQDDNKRLAEDNKDLHMIATDNELDEQQRKYEADKKRYSWHNIRTVLENSDYKTIEDEVEAIISFHTEELKKKDRANYPAHKEANKTEYKQIVRDRVFAVLDEITNKTLDGVLRAVTGELRVNVIKDKISTVNRSTGRRISNIEKKYEEVKPVDEDEYVTLDIHPFSLNYQYTYRNGKQVRTDAYNKWIADFPWYQVPSLKDWGVDPSKKIELSILFTAKKGFDSDNVIKSLQDMLFNRVMQMDDYDVKIGTVDRIGTVNSFADGKIKIHIRNI